MAAIDGTSRLLSIVERELKPVNPTPGPNKVHERVSRAFLEAVSQGNVEDTEAVLKRPDVDHLTPDDYGIALQSATKASHFAMVNLLLRSGKTKYAPPILGQCAIQLVRHREALESVQEITRFARFTEVSIAEKTKIIISAIDADHPQIVDYLVHCQGVIDKIEDKKAILNKMAQSRGYIREFLNLFAFEPDDLVNAAKAAVEAQCLISYLEILNSDQFKQKIYEQADKFLSAVDMTPLLDEIQKDLPLLKGRISNEAFGILFVACAKAGRLILLPEQFDQIPQLDLRRALVLAIRCKQPKVASEIALSTEWQKILDTSNECLSGLFKLICETMPQCPSLVMVLCALLTAERLPHLSKKQLERFISTVSNCWHLEADLFPLFLKVFEKATKANRFGEVSAQVIQDSFISATRDPHVNRDAMVQAFVNCGRFQEIRADNLFTCLNVTCSFSHLRYIKLEDKPIRSLEDALSLLTPLGVIRSGDGPVAHLIRDFKRIIETSSPIVRQANSFISFFDFKQIFVKDPGSPYNVELERLLIAAAGLGLQHIVHSILSCRLDEIRPFIFERAVHYSLSGNRVIVCTCDRKDGFDGFLSVPDDTILFDLEGKAAIAEEMLFSPKFQGVPLNLGKLVFMLANIVDKKDFLLIERILQSDRFKKLPPDEQAKVRKASKGESESGCVVS